MKHLVALFLLGGMLFLPATATAAPSGPSGCDGLARAISNSPKLDFSNNKSGDEILITDRDEVSGPLVQYAKRCAAPAGADGFVEVNGRELGLKPPAPSDPGTGAGERLTIKICYESKKINIWITIIFD